MELKRNTNTQSIVKGLLITSVIFFHATMFSDLPNYTNVLSEFSILMTLFPFLMMVFFFYAGYNYTPEKRTIGENIKRRSLQLLIPLLVAFVVSTLLVIAMRVPNGESWEGIKNAILYFLMSEPLAFMIGFPSNGIISLDLVICLGILWFLYVLYIVSVFFYLIVDYAIKKPVRIFSIVFGLLLVGFCIGQFVGVYLPYSVQCYPVVLAMMLLAAYLKKFNFLDRKIESKKDVCFTIINAIVAEAIVAGIGLFGYYVLGSTMLGTLPGGQFDKNVRGFDAFISVGIGLLGTYAMHQISRALSLIPFVSTALDWYGKRSSYVYLFHPIILVFIYSIVFGGNKVMGEFEPYLFTFMTMGILIAIFLIVDFIIYQIKKRKKPEEATN